MSIWSRWTVSIALVTGVVIGIAYGLSQERSRTVTRGNLRMGTLFEITVVGPSDASIESWIDSAFAEVARIEALTSDYDSASAVSRLSASDGRPIPVPAEIAGLLDRSQTISTLTGGAFDVAIGAATHFWRMSEHIGHVPSDGELDEAAAIVSEGFNVDTAASTVALPLGAVLDLGGVAKGHAVDRAADLLVDLGATGVLVNGGGDMATRGVPEDRDEWAIGIRHPRRDAEAYFGVVRMGGGAIATSGDYERGFTIGDSTYGHILDPATARPATGVVSATVRAPDALLADALSTAAFVLGPDAAVEVIEQLLHVEGLIVTEHDGELAGRVTSGFLEQASIDTSAVRLVSPTD